MTTRPDYPAAHSMDSTWFAVDADGEVALFETGEGGSMPTRDFPMGGESGSGGSGLEDHELLAYALVARAQGDERLRALLPADPEALARIIADSDTWEHVQPLLRSCGIWTYACQEQVATPYVREGEAQQPLRLDQLAPQLQRRFAKARLPVRFREAPAIAPGEHVPVSAWDSVWIDLQGRPHATKDGKQKDVDELAAQLAEAGVEWSFAAAEGEVLVGDAFYEAVERMMESGRANRGRNDDDGGPRPDGGGLRGFLGRLFGG